MVARVRHTRVSGAAANPDVLVDGPAWDADHTITGVRELLTANRTYYVRTNGDDINGTGLTNDAGAFRNLLKAWNIIADTLDLQGYTVTIQLAPGTYDGLNTSKGVVGANGLASVFILGSPTPSDVVIATSGSDAFGFGALNYGMTQLTIGGVKITTTVAGNCINISGGGCGVVIGTPGYPVEFGTCAQTHIVGNHNAWIIAGTNNKVSGNALIHCAALSGAVVALHGTTLTFSNSPVFSFFAYADTNGTLYLDSMTFTNGGTVTGTRYFAGSEGLIYALGGETYLPGNSTGVKYEGGRYVKDVGDTGFPLFTLGVQSYVAPGTGVATALAVNVGTAGAVVVNGGALGTPSSGVATNLTGLPLSGGVIGTIEPQGRLTLVSATPVMTTTQSAKTTLYYALYKGNLIPLYNGTNMVPTAFTELSVATTDTTKNPAAIAASKVNHWFVWTDSGTLRLTHSVDWTNDTTESAGAALVRVNGILLNAVSITNGPAAQRGTYVGTTRSNASSQLDWILGGAAAGGTASFLGVWNAYNRVIVKTIVSDSTGSWSIAANTKQAMNASNNNRVTFVSGLAEDAASANISSMTNAGAGSFSGAAIGYDSTSALSGINYLAGSTGAASGAFGQYSTTGSGAHFMQALDINSGASVATSYGNGTLTGYLQGGLHFEFRM